MIGTVAISQRLTDISQTQEAASSQRCLSIKSMTGKRLATEQRRHCGQDDEEIEVYLFVSQSWGQLLLNWFESVASKCKKCVWEQCTSAAHVFGNITL